MKTEFTEVSETRKHLTFEIPSESSKPKSPAWREGYSRSARVPGFRQGKVPAAVVRQRYKDQILHDVAHDLIPRMVGTALQERGLDPVAVPDIRDVVLEEGKPLTFLADFETMPADRARRVCRPVAAQAAGRARSGRGRSGARATAAARRAVDRGRRSARGRGRHDPRGSHAHAPRPPDPAGRRGEPPVDLEGKPEALQNVSIEIGNTANPPEFNTHLAGAPLGATRDFAVTYPDDYEVKELAGATIDYAVTVKGIRRKELLPLDDDFAKEVSELDTLDALRERIREDLQHGAEHDAEHKMRHDLLAELGGRVKSVPDVLVDQEIDRRLEEFVRRLADQGIDPMKAEIDWQEFRERQRQPAVEHGQEHGGGRRSRAARVHRGLDEDVEQEIEKFAARAGRTPRPCGRGWKRTARLARIRAGVRREKTMAWLIEKGQCDPWITRPDCPTSAPSSSRWWSNRPTAASARTTSSRAC